MQSIIVTTILYGLGFDKIVHASHCLVIITMWTFQNSLLKIVDGKTQILSSRIELAHTYILENTIDVN